MPPRKITKKVTTPSFYSKYNREWAKDNKNLIIALSLGIILLITLFFLKRDWFIAATVNGSPVTNLELQQRLNEEYKEQALDQLVNDKIVFDAAAQKGIIVSDQEVQDRLKEFETRFGGSENLDNLLKQQGMTRASLSKRLKPEIALEKLYASEATVSAQEIDDYIRENSTLFASKDPAEQKTEAEQSIKNQKLQKIIFDKFQELKDQAKVIIF